MFYTDPSGNVCPEGTKDPLLRAPVPSPNQQQSTALVPYDPDFAAKQNALYGNGYANANPSLPNQSADTPLLDVNSQVNQPVKPVTQKPSSKDSTKQRKSTLDYVAKIEKKGNNYYTDKKTLDEIGCIESRGLDFSKLNKQLQSSRPSSEGGIGTSNVYKYSDLTGTKFIIHEVTDSAGNIIHRDFDSVRIPSGQLILKE